MAFSKSEILLTRMPRKRRKARNFGFFAKFARFASFALKSRHNIANSSNDFEKTTNEGALKVCQGLLAQEENHNHSRKSIGTCESRKHGEKQ